MTTSQVVVFAICVAIYLLGFISLIITARDDEKFTNVIGTAILWPVLTVLSFVIILVVLPIYAIITKAKKR